MPNIFTEFTEKVGAANSIQDVMPELLPDFKGFDQAGASRLKCLCPFHKGDDASFMVYPDDQSYRCLRCDRRGDVFDLVQGVTGVDFIQAATILAERAGIDIPQAANADLQFDSKKRQIQDILVAAADLYWLNSMLLPTMSPQRLEKEVKQARERQNQAKYGYAKNVNLAQYLASKGFDMELAKKAGVVTGEGTDFFQERDIMPVWARGRVVCMTGCARHYSNSPEHLDLPVNEFVKMVPFEDDTAGTWRNLLIALRTEDATTLQEWGYDVLRPAETDLSGRELQLLAGHKAIYVSCCNDRMPEALTLGWQIPQKTGVMPYLVRLPGGGGANEFAAQGHSRYEYGERLKQGETPLDLTLGVVQGSHGPDRTGLVGALFDCLAKLSELDIPTYRKKVVKALGITSREFDAYLKSARGKLETSAGVDAEDIDEGSCLAIHPALDYLEQIGVVSVALDVSIDSRVVTRPYLITSDRKRLEPDGAVLQMGGQRVLFRSEPRAPCEKRWRKADIDRFLAGDDPDPGQTFSRLLDIVRKHIDFRDPVEAEILSLWCMGSYLFPLFGSYPYLHLYGFKGTGKTQTMTLASKLAFNMVLASGITPSATFRLVQYSRCCVGLDEAENLRGSRDRDSRELLGLLRAGCKKGAAAIRAEAVPYRGLMPIQYDVYSPKMIASIDPIEDILGSRCISINMLRTKNAEIGRVELSDNGEDWYGMRHELYCFALNHFHEVRQLYADEASLRILLNRDHELWLPLFSVAKLLAQRGADGVLDRLVEYARVASAEASDSGLKEFDLALMEVLVSLVGKDGAESKWIAAKEMERRLRQVLAGSHLPRDVPQNIGYSLKNLGLLHSPRSKKRTATGTMYYIQPGQLMSASDRWGIAAPTELAAEEARPAGVTGSSPQPGPKRSNN